MAHHCFQGAISVLCYSWLLLFLPTCVGGQVLSFDYLGSSTRDACVECSCNSWSLLDKDGEREERFTVNCTGMKYGLFQGRSIPKNIPFNTTDLVVSEYLLGTLSLSSFPNYDFPLNPMLKSLVLISCHIDFISAEAFRGNSFISIENITLTNNMIDMVMEGTFVHHPYLINVSMKYNHLQKIQKGSFRNLPRVVLIDLSHNALTSIELEAFDNTPLLEVLNLSFNFISTIPGRDITQMSSLQLLDLSYNGLNCSCDMAWVLQLNTSVETKGMCLYPSQLNGTHIDNLTHSDFLHCFDDYSGTTINTMLFSSILALIVVIIIFYYFYYYSVYKENTFVQQVGQIKFDVRHCIGLNVFKGKLLRDGRNVAVKKIPKVSRECARELKSLVSIAEKGPFNNVIQYLWFENDSIYTYIALELCGGDLWSAIRSKKGEFAQYLTPDSCLSQIMNGLKYVHELKIQHRDIKPQNILWKYCGAHQNQIRFMLADFDLSQSDTDVSSHKSMRGTKGWAAPELWCCDKDRTFSADVFSMGCIFYFVLSKGYHPFGPISDLGLCQTNIMDSKFVSTLDHLLETQTPFVAQLAKNLVQIMILHEPEKRPRASSVLEYPLSWTKEKMMDFYLEMGRYMEDANLSVSSLKDELIKDSELVFEGSWMERLDAIVQSDLKGFKKQSKNICYLLRAVRNKIEHFRHLGPKLAEIYKSPEGVMDYYNEHFPYLLSYTFHVKSKWDKRSLV